MDTTSPAARLAAEMHRQQKEDEDKIAALIRDGFKYREMQLQKWRDGAAIELAALAQ